MRLTAEEEVAHLTQNVRHNRVTQLSESPTGHEEGATASDLNQQVLVRVAVIYKVAARSVNLKGTFQRALKEAMGLLYPALHDDLFRLGHFSHDSRMGLAISKSKTMLMMIDRFATIQRSDVTKYETVHKKNNDSTKQSVERQEYQKLN